ncbi:MAG TPA: xanthine dehydrogenase family protein subunit M [Roseiarcus sp.]|jgi:carbon-monoxide dehydrogenase medium subunit
MYPAAFRYHVPESIAEAVGMAAELPDARFLAGGHSLIPLMKQRLAQPSDLIDLRKVTEMRQLSALDGQVRIGAAVTHWEAHSSALLSSLCPLLSETAGHIGDPQVRNCGTLGGSLAYADPGADYPACILALNAVLVCESLAGRRSIDSSDWFKGLFTTALDPGELLVEIHIPVIRGCTGSAYRKLPHPASRMAVVGVAVELTLDRAGVCERIQIGINGLGSNAIRAGDIEEQLIGRAIDDDLVARACASLPRVQDISGDRFVSAADKLPLCRNLIRSAVSAALKNAVRTEV